MKELVEYIVSKLTGSADITVEYSEDKPGDIVITAPRDEIGKVIGKQGRIAKSIRTIVKAASSKAGSKRYYTVSIVEKEGGEQVAEEEEEESGE